MDAPLLQSIELPQEDVTRSLPRKRAVWLYLAGILFILVFVGFGVISWKHRTTPAPNRADAAHQPSAPAVVASASPQTGAVRLLAGYSGQPHIDAAGAVWGPDKYFRSGRPWPRPPGFLARTNDPFLFPNTRTGEFSYDLPLKPGTYELHLYFVESNYGPGLGGGENDRTFSVDINGERLLPGFDIESDALGPNVADERIFKDIQPAKDGKLHIAFEDSRGEPIVSAIEVVPGIPHKQVPIRLVMQPSSFIDHAGQLWRPDNYYLDGQTSVRRPPPAGSSDPELYAMERYGHFTYAIPVDTRGRYTLALHFVEDYFGPQASGVGGVGSRRFRIMCNGIALADDFDILKRPAACMPSPKPSAISSPQPRGN